MFLAICYGIRPEATTKRQFQIFKDYVTHHEVHIGNTAFSIFVDAGKSQQSLQFRRVEDSTRVFGLPMKDKIFMCETRPNDNTILTYMKKNWKGPFRSIERGCHDFSKMLIEFVCANRLGIDSRFQNKFQFPKSSTAIRSAGKAFSNMPFKRWLPKNLRESIYPIGIKELISIK